MDWNCISCKIQNKFDFMERSQNIKKYKEEYFLYLIFTVGIIGHLVDQLIPIMLYLTPFTLLLTGSVVLYKSYKSSNKLFLYWIIITYLITFSLEVIGVKTGLIFGEYLYGETLGLKLFDVPLIIGFNWVFVILGAISIARIISKNNLVVSLIAALIAVIFDFILEPVAIKLDYWQWSENIIPLQNYAAWFLIAFFSSFLYEQFKIETDSKISIHYLIIQFIFFLFINLFQVR